MVITGIYLTKDQRRILKERAKQLKISMAELIRRILDKELNTLTKDVEKPE